MLPHSLVRGILFLLFPQNARKVVETLKSYKLLSLNDNISAAHRSSEYVSLFFVSSIDLDEKMATISTMSATHCHPLPPPLHVKIS